MCSVFKISEVCRILYLNQDLIQINEQNIKDSRSSEALS